MNNKKFKICIRCGKEKLLSEFGKHSDHIDSLKSWCKICIKEYNKQWYEENKEKIKIRQKQSDKEYYKLNKEKILKREKEFHEKYPWKKILSSIKQRCENPSHNSYKNYGYRGIENFLTEKDIEFMYNRDKAYLMNKPSIDRKNNDGNYTLENCQFIELSENSVKDHRKPILQYDLNGNFIREWNSTKEAGIKLKIHCSGVCNALRGIQKTSHGFIWRYKNE